MTFWRNIAGLAARRVDAAECTACPPGLPGEDPAFSTAVTALGAKLAKADGYADHHEFAAFSEVFQADARAERNVRRLYELAGQTTHGFESYARRLAKRYGQCPQLLEDVLDGLFHIAKADGAITDHELAYLDQVAHLFGLTAPAFQRLRATHLGSASDDPYVVLSVAPDAPDRAVREAWKRALSEAHPDRALARGLPAEFVEVAHAKSAAINAAYDAITRDRKAWAVRGAA
ncbi:MAG: dnaJ-class molecular chaperone [Caulobacteraceae bacterium]|nr:dnaJ-class molecular chaperone [Caulobacteraceae bacterium]